MLSEVKQPVAWELQGELRELVSVRPNMQPAEWQHRFSKLWPHNMMVLDQSTARQEMFDFFSKKGLSKRHYASELDMLIANNEGWRAKISDMFLVCTAFPVCDVGVCHHRSIDSRRGYEDKNGRTVSHHSVRAFFGHRGQLSKRLSEMHKAVINQVNHDQAIDIMLSHLMRHKAGFYVIDRCPNCKERFEALRIEKPADFRAKFRECDEQGRLKFEYDIGVMDKAEGLIAIIEAYNTHRMGADKRAYATSMKYPWVEYSVKEMLASLRKSIIHTGSNGWLELEAIKLKIGHSGATYCQACSREIEAVRLAKEKREQLLKRITESKEEGHSIFQNVLVPAEQALDKIAQELDYIEPWLSTSGLNKVELELANTEVLVHQIQTDLTKLEPFVNSLQILETEIDVEAKYRKDVSICTKTGLEMTTEFNIATVSDFNKTLLKYSNICNTCREILERIKRKQREFILSREEIAFCYESEP